MNTRVMPYLSTYQLAITYEVDPRSFVVLRNDFTGFEWISNIGGLGFLFSIGALISHSVDSPSMFLTASMLAKGKVHTIKAGSKSMEQLPPVQLIDKQPTDFLKFDETEIKEGCCTDLRTKLATSRCLSQKCKKSLGGTKAAILNKQNQKMSKYVHVTHILKHMRVVEGLIREKYEMKKFDWDLAWKRFGPIVLSTDDELGDSLKDSFESDSSMSSGVSERS